MSSKPSLLLLGTGLMGGDLIFNFLKSGAYELRVAARRQNIRDELATYGIKTVGLDFQDAEGLSTEVAKHDIVINAAHCDDMDLARAIILGLEKRQKAGLPKQICMQISGGGVYGHLFNTHQPADFCYDDTVPEEIDKLSPDAPHRNVDLLFKGANDRGLGNIAILIPMTVYGGGQSPFKTLTTQYPMILNEALKDGSVPYGKRDNLFNAVHVEDNTRGIILIIESIANGRVTTAKNPYFNVSNAYKPTWGVVAKRMAQRLVHHGIFQSPKTHIRGEWDFYGIYDANSTRLRSLGWSERFGSPQDLLDGIDFEVETYLRTKKLIPDIPTPETVLVTGGSGYVGSSIVLELLRNARRFNVRLAVRGKEQYDDWVKAYPGYARRLEWTTVSSLTDPSGYTEAVKNVKHVVHTASPGTKTTGDRARDLLDPAISGTLSILKASKTQTSIESVVFTSSIVSHIDFTKLRGPNDVPYENKDRFDITYEDALALPADGSGPFLAYAASKTLADRQAFEYHDKTRPSWRLSSVAPCYVLGPTDQPRLNSIQDLRSTSAEAFSLLIDREVAAPCPVPWYTDVRDVARVHVDALLDPAAAGKRYLLGAEKADFDLAAKSLREHFPKDKSRIGAPTGKPMPPTFLIDGTAAEHDFDFKYRRFERSMLDWGNQVLSLPVKA